MSAKRDCCLIRSWFHSDRNLFVTILGLQDGFRGLLTGIKAGLDGFGIDFGCSVFYRGLGRPGCRRLNRGCTVRFRVGWSWAENHKITNLPDLASFRAVYRHARTILPMLNVQRNIKPISIILGEGRAGPSETDLNLDILTGP